MYESVRSSQDHNQLPCSTSNTQRELGMGFEGSTAESPVSHLMSFSQTPWHPSPAPLPVDPPHSRYTIGPLDLQVTAVYSTMYVPFGIELSPLYPFVWGEGAESPATTVRKHGQPAVDYLGTVCVCCVLPGRCTVYCSFKAGTKHQQPPPGEFVGTARAGLTAQQDGARDCS